jgi:hypothetical protein
VPPAPPWSRFRACACPVFSTIGARIGPLGVTGCVKTHAFALSERPQGANSGPEPISRLGHQHEVLALHLVRELANFARSQSRNFLTSHPRHVHRGFVTPLPWRSGFIHLGAWCSGARWRAAHWTGHFTGCPGRGAPQCCFHRSNGYWQDDYRWLWAWVTHLAFWVQQGEWPSVHQLWCPPWRPSSLWGTWSRGGGSYVGCFNIPPYFILLRGSSLVRSGA